MIRSIMGCTMRLSKLRWAVLFQLAKAWRINLDVSIPRVIKVFNLNSMLVYRFIRELESDGLVERTGRGRWVLSDNRRAELLAEYVLESAGNGIHGYWVSGVPEIYYYIAEPPSIEWLGYPGKVLVIVDECLENRLKHPNGYRVIYTSMRGRRWRFEWSLGYARGVVEQSVADLLSYDPSYPVERYILMNMDWINIDEIARRTTVYGLKRLSTFLAFLKLATGRTISTSFNYVSLLDEEILDEELGEYIMLVFTNNIVESRRL